MSLYIVHIWPFFFGGIFVVFFFCVGAGVDWAAGMGVAANFLLGRISKARDDNDDVDDNDNDDASSSSGFSSW